MGNISVYEFIYIYNLYCDLCDQCNEFGNKESTLDFQSFMKTNPEYVADMISDYRKGIITI